MKGSRTRFHKPGVPGLSIVGLEVDCERFAAKALERFWEVVV